MPPARSIFIDTNQILASIAEIAAEQHVAALKRTINYRDKERREALEFATWVPRNLVRLTCRQLTPSERIRAQQAVRQMEADGLVELGPSCIRLTEAGAKKITTTATSATH